MERQTCLSVTQRAQPIFADLSAKIVQASGTPNLFERYATSAAYFRVFIRKDSAIEVKAILISPPNGGISPQNSLFCQETAKQSPLFVHFVAGMIPLPPEI
ncbi:MAG: hypothetical protein E7093_08540 [Bacteroidales bacterium]|nr:hypothetical protein [Bacteroidales bacterium]